MRLPQSLAVKSSLESGMHAAMALISDGPYCANGALAVAGLTSKESPTWLTLIPGASREWVPG